MEKMIRISGKKITLPENPGVQWTFHQRPGGWIIAESNHGVRKRFMFHESPKGFSISLNGNLWHGEWLNFSSSLSNFSQGNLSSRSGYSDSNDESSSDTELVAQFPGKVRRILVQKGDFVNEGDELLLVEAMKMEFSIKAPFSGQVMQVLVEQQQQLSPGDRFVDLEKGTGKA